MHLAHGVCIRVPFHSISFRRDTFVLTTWTCDRQRPDFSADLVDGDDGAFLIK
jgi:hypothetical protein